MGAKKKVSGFIVLVAMVVGIGCGQDLPFEYRYISANTVQIQYMEKVYELQRFGGKVNAPFDYVFESDGDLDITIAGKTYDIDSPYDIDKPKKKKVTKKRKTTKKKR